MTKKAAKAKTTAVSVGKQFTQDCIPEMLEKVNAQIAALTKVGNEDRPTTKGTIFPDANEICNINDVASLIHVHASIGIREKAYNASVKKLGLNIKVPPFAISGHSSKMWEDDIKEQLMVVIHSKKVATLNKIKEKLEARRSEEQKLSDSLHEINDLMDEANEF